MFRPSESVLRERFYDRLSRIEGIPTFPEAVRELAEVLERPDRSIEQVAEVIKQDPAITARLLRLANSAYYRPAGMKEAISSVAFAVARVGLDKIRAIVTALGVFSLFEGRWKNVDRRTFWRHCLDCAHVATLVRLRNLERTRVLEPLADELYVGGLLHDIGIVILDQHFRPEFTGILTVARAARLPLQEAERAMIGIDHARVAGFVAECWNLAAAVTQAVAFHHDPLEAPSDHQAVAAAVHLADYVTRAGEAGLSNRAEEQVPLAAIKALGFGLEDLRWFQKQAARITGTSAAIASAA